MHYWVHSEKFFLQNYPAYKACGVRIAKMGFSEGAHCFNFFIQCFQIIRFNFATNHGAIPTNITTINHKFPVVISYALSSSLKVSPIDKPRINSKTIVRRTHKNPIFQYTFGLPFPNRGMKINEPVKISKHRVIPLAGKANSIPIKGAITISRKMPFSIASGIIESQIKIDFFIIFITFFDCSLSIKLLCFYVLSCHIFLQTTTP